MPYTIEISDERLAAIKAKVDAYDWSELSDAGGWTVGVCVDDLKHLVGYCQDTYDWRKVEARLNRLPHVMAEVEGEHIHFIHVRGDGSEPPLLLLHGWPASFLEFEALLDPLSADGHDVIVPSLPGYAFSKPITGMMAYQQPDALLGLYINMVNLRAKDAAPTTFEEKAWASRFAASLDPVFLPPPRSFAEKTYDIVHWQEMPKGGTSLRWRSRPCCSPICAASSPR